MEEKSPNFCPGGGSSVKKFVPGVGLLKEHFNGPVVSSEGGWQLVKLIAA